MKAVILAGGLGTRMREETEFKPKPMVEIGGKPVLWHLMMTLYQQGIDHFIVLTGYKGGLIDDFFRNDPQGSATRYESKDGMSVVTNLDNSNVPKWNVDVIWTGDETPTAGRLLQAREYIGEDPFLCTYGDGLADIDLEQLTRAHRESGKMATMTVYQPENRFGVVEFDNNGMVTRFKEKPKMSDWINIGFFVFEREVFNYLTPHAMLEDEPLAAIANDRKLGVNPHSGFWEPMDTFREYQHLNNLWITGAAKWKNW